VKAKRVDHLQNEIWVESIEVSEDLPFADILELGA
jgi:hypothetical protein